MTLSLFKERLVAAFDLYFGRLVAILPSLLGGLLLLLVGYGLARLLRYLTKRVLRSTGIEHLSERSGLERVFARFGGSVHVAGRLVYWLVFIFFVLAAAEVMDLQLVSDALRSFFAYLPSLAMALAILVFGFWLGLKVRALADGFSSAMGLSGGKVVGQLLFGIIVLFMGITALNVAGIDTTLVTSNILVFLGGVLVAFSVAYGMASKDILTNILSSYYGKDRFERGQTVRIGQDVGVIERIDSISLTLRTDDKLVLIPTSKLITERIEVLQPQEEPIVIP